MPELPEVETVRLALSPAIAGASILAVQVGRPDMRFPFPDQLAQRLVGFSILSLGRRGKYLLAPLSSGETMILHLGMSGRLSVSGSSCAAPGTFYFADPPDPRHDHVKIDVEGPAGAASLVFNDPRRFGFLDLAPSGELERCRHFARMGPEPLSATFTPEAFSARLAMLSSPIKSAMLDQRVVAGVGNIYACEALFRAGISPRRKSASVAGVRAHRLHSALRAVLTDAIQAGGSTLRDFAHPAGQLGAFQQQFAVYDRHLAPCVVCAAPVGKIVQSGRSTYFCGRCQR